MQHLLVEVNLVRLRREKRGALVLLRRRVFVLAVEAGDFAEYRSLALAAFPPRRGRTDLIPIGKKTILAIAASTATCRRIISDTIDRQREKKKQTKECDIDKQ